MQDFYIKNFITFVYYILFIAAGYLSGSVLYGYIFPKIIKGVNVFEVSPDGNAGTTNAFKYGGFWCGVLALAGDLLKGFIPVLVASKFIRPDDYLFVPILLAPVFGHAFPAFFKKKGGKCIAVSFGVLFATPAHIGAGAALAVAYVFFSTVVVFDPHSLRTVVTYAVWSVFCVIFFPAAAIKLTCFALSLLIFIRHYKSLRAEKEEFGVHVLFFKKRSENEAEKRV